MKKLRPNRNFYLAVVLAFCVGLLAGFCQISSTSVSNSADDKSVAEQVKMPSAVEFGLLSGILVAQHYDEIVATAENLATEQKKQAGILGLADENGCLGSFRVTRYDGCEQCCGSWAKNRPTDENGKTIVTGASGRRLTSGVSCAADRSIPFGTKLYIPQINMVVTVEDRAAEWIEERYDGKFIDLYFDEHAHYIDGATDYMDVYIIE